MKKEEILEKSRAENKNQDIFEKEILKQASLISSIVLVCLATLFLVLQILAGGGINYSLYVMVFSASMSMYWVKYHKLRRKLDLFLAAGQTLLVIAGSVAHICSLFSAL